MGRIARTCAIATTLIPLLSPTIALPVTITHRIVADAATQQWVSRLPEEWREPFKKAVADAFDRLDASILQFLGEVDSLAAKHMAEAACRLNGALYGNAPTVLGGVGDAASLTRFTERRLGSLRGGAKPQAISDAYLDVARETGAMVCALKAQQVEAMANELHGDLVAADRRAVLWRNQRDRCPNAKACLASLNLSNAEFLRRADPRDVAQVDAHSRRASIDWPESRPFDFDPQAYSSAMLAMLEIERSVRIAKLARVETGKATEEQAVSTLKAATQTIANVGGPYGAGSKCNDGQISNSRSRDKEIRSALMRAKLGVEEAREKLIEAQRVAPERATSITTHRAQATELSIRMERLRDELDRVQTDTDALAARCSRPPLRPIPT